MSCKGTCSCCFAFLLSAKGIASTPGPPWSLPLGSVAPVMQSGVDDHPESLLSVAHIGHVAVTFCNKEQLPETCALSESRALAWPDFRSSPGPACTRHRREGALVEPVLERPPGSGFSTAAASHLGI